MTNIDIARRYLALLTDPASTAEQLDAVIAPEIIVEEAPNLVAPTGRKRDYQAIREGFTLSKTLLTEQQYTVDNAVESGDHVILEVRWRGVLARGFGKVPAGAEMRARCAMFLELRDGRLVAQRNYDCYEPIGS
jgi:ketosteroid isomerase-like protein